MSSSSRWKDLFNHLKQKGFDVYPPATKVGECTSPYLVVKMEGSTKLPQFSTDKELYSVLCYVPLSNYSDLESYKQSVKEAMKELKPMFYPNGFETASYYDEFVKAHMISIEYRNYKKL